MKRNIKGMEKYLMAAFFGILALGLSYGGIQAAEYPEKTIKMIIGYAPGGTVDLSARALISVVSEQLGQPVVIITKTGASGTIAINEIVSSKPDGYTIADTTIFTLTLSPYEMKVKFDSLKDFEPIVYFASVKGSGLQGLLPK